MKSEINLYRRDMIDVLTNLSKYHNYKGFREMTRDDIISFLDSFRKPLQFRNNRGIKSGRGIMHLALKHHSGNGDAALIQFMVFRRLLKICYFGSCCSFEEEVLLEPTRQNI
jgi:hypothetical protein